MLLIWNDAREILMSGVGVKLGDVLEGQWGTDMDLLRIISDPTIYKSAVANGVNIDNVKSFKDKESSVNTSVGKAAYSVGELHMIPRRRSLLPELAL